MCKCTPEIRTPFCGKPGCEMPPEWKTDRHISMCDFLTSLGCWRRISNNNRFVLDNIDRGFYLEFDMEPDNQRQEPRGECDILIVTPDGMEVRIMTDCNRHQVLRLLFALGANRFSDTTKKEMYSLSNPLRVP